MTNSNNIKGLYPAAQSFLVIKRVKEFFENFLSKIKKALQELSLSNAEYRALEGDIEAQEKILEMWTRCLEADKQTEAKKGDSVNAGDRGNGGRVNDSVGTEGLQSYSTGDNESLRTNSKESSKLSYSLKENYNKAVSQESIKVPASSLSIFNSK